MTTRQIDLTATIHTLGYAARAADDAEDAAKWDGRTRFIASTANADRYEDIVDQATWKLDRFKANPRAPWGHDYTIPPVGRVPEVAIEDAGLGCTIQWDHRNPLNTLAQLVAEQYRTHFLDAVSVGFRPGRMIPRSQLPKEDARYKEAGYGAVYYDCELLEISAVVIPANADALAAKGLPACKLTAADVETEVRRVLRALLADDAEARGLIEALALDTIDGADALRQARIAEREDRALRQMFG